MQRQRVRRSQKVVEDLRGSERVNGSHVQWLKEGREPSIHFGSRDSALQARPPPVFMQGTGTCNRRDDTRPISPEMYKCQGF